MKYVQAYISNISFPTSLEELYFYTEKVLVIDTEELYLYNDETKALLIITKLDELSTNNDIQLLRDRIIKLL